MANNDFMQDFLNPVSLEPSSAETDISPGMPSVFGMRNSQSRAAAAQQFIKSQLGNLPEASELQRKQMQNQLELLPQQQELAKKKLAQEYSELQGKPVGQFVDEAAELYPNLDVKNPDNSENAKQHEALVQRWKDRHPGLQLPQDLSSYQGENTLRHLKDAYNMKRYSSEFGQKVQLEREKGESQIEASKIRGVDAAAIRAQVMAELRAAGMLKENMNPQQEITQLKREKAKPGTSSSRRQEIDQELEDLVNPLIEEQIRKKWGDESTALILGQGQPGFAEQRAAGMESDRQTFRKAHGLESKSDEVSVIAPDGRKGTISRSKLEQAKKQGYKEAK